MTKTPFTIDLTHVVGGLTAGHPCIPPKRSPIPPGVIPTIPEIPPMPQMPDYGPNFEGTKWFHVGDKR